MTKLKGAVIGCGFFAQNHLNAWKDLDDIELVAICDRNRHKAEAAAKRFAIPQVYSDAEAMFAGQRLDFVDIPTTMETHEDLVCLAARHNVPVIVQKPFGPDIAACRRMVAACAKARVPLMVHENFRFQVAFREIRRILDEGALGPLHFGRLSWRTGIDVYANQPYLKTVERFIILDLGIHLRPSRSTHSVSTFGLRFGGQLRRQVAQPYDKIRFSPPFWHLPRRNSNAGRVQCEKSGLATFVLVEAAYRSADSGKAVVPCHD